LNCIRNGRQATIRYGWLAWLEFTNIWVRGKMENSDDATNTLYLANSKLGSYISGSISIFKCPGDYSDHVRTYFMSQAVGTNPDPPVVAMDGP